MTKAEKYLSFAGTDAVYAGVLKGQFRARKVDGNVRIHILKSALRVRDEYYAIDIPQDEWKALVRSVSRMK
jgi:hypothetical protein